MSACQHKNVISIEYEIDSATFLSILDPLILKYFREQLSVFFLFVSQTESLFVKNYSFPINSGQ